MNEVSTEKWFIHDPDKIMKIAAGVTHLSAALEPREDLMFFEHKSKPLNIDFGFYGDEVTLEGEWVVCVLNTSLEEPWDDPIDRISSNSFVEGLKNVQSCVAKYT
ncbi:hypothetical protein [Marinobacter sp. ANT_B65]|uniref:hypothetical protein n=1 Tax=Marinobacter sp. ANT_B65 TaxID=2039467 RepID=UPI000BBEDDB7|nr:hypothetical protein [Marinobacter sp. ANT_B65]PCM45800.1 hypothetical protein CPA50_07465 [Marinobacter sp. ANT_B65]